MKKFKYVAITLLSFLATFSLSALASQGIGTYSPYNIDSSSQLNSLRTGSAQSIQARNGATRVSSRNRLNTNAGVTVPLSTTHLSIANKITAVLNTKKGTAENALISEKQQEGLQNLSSSVGDGGRISVHFNHRKGTPTFLRIDRPLSQAGLLAKGSTDAEVTARLFLDENKDLLKLDNINEDVILHENRKELDGATHLTYKRQINGVPIWGSELKVHIDKNNQVYLLNGRYEPRTEKLDAVPIILLADALTAAFTELEISTAMKTGDELVFYPVDDENLVLTYKLDILGSYSERWIVFVNAVNGNVVHKFKNIHSAGATVSASGQDLSGTSKVFTAWSEDSTYYMIDPTFPLNDPTHDPLANPKSKGDSYILDAQNGTSTFYYSTSVNLNSGWDQSAVSAMVNTRKVYDYFKNTHGRNGVDDKNMHFQVIIHFDTNFDNAFWNGAYMVFGDGGDTFEPLAGCLDVTAHEMSHGVVEHTAHLIYENQSGALNESFSDIFGAMVDRDDWLMGEDCTKVSPGYLRNLKDPSKGDQPGHMDEYQNLPNTVNGDNGGVHINSGIPNRAAYLLASGLSDEGLGTSIGKEKTEKIFYRALSTYLTASAYFIDARDATIQAAEDIHGSGSSEVAAVKKAWDSVGLTNGYQDVPDQTPTDTDPVAGADVMFYFYPIDGTRDYEELDEYALYAQTMNNPLIYDEALDVSVGNSVSGSGYSKPAIYTDNDESIVFYVGSDLNVYGIDLEADEEFQITDTNDVFNIAVSPNGQYVAFTGDFGANILVLDLKNDTSELYPLLPPSYVSETDSLATIQYADSISFDYSSSVLVFDALQCVSFESSLCSAGNGYRYWSIGMIDPSNGRLAYPFANQSPDIDLGFPAFSQNNNYVIAMDYADYSSGVNVLSQVLSVNFELQELGSIYNFGLNSDVIYGVPTFWGADNYITIQVPTGAAAGTVAKRVKLGSNGDSDWEGVNGVVDAINPYAAAMPMMHRMGKRSITGKLKATSNINFGDVKVNSELTKKITIRNTGNSDVEIINVSIKGNNFKHNATNLLVPRNSELDVNVTFDSGSSLGTKTGTLKISTKNGASDLKVSLIAETVGEGSSSGGGSLFYILLMLLSIQLWKAFSFRLNRLNNRAQ